MPDESPTTPEEEPAVEERPAGDGALGDNAAGRWRLVAVVLALALVGCLVAIVLLWLDRSDLSEQVAEYERTSDAEVAAEEAAVNAMVRMTTYHHRTVEEDYSWVEDLGTAEFEETWRPASQDAIRLIETVKASAEGAVINSAAEAVDDDEVRVLLFTDQELRQRGTKGSDLEETRVEMTMVREDAGWLVDSLDVQNFFAEDPALRDQD